MSKINKLKIYSIKEIFNDFINSCGEINVLKKQNEKETSNFDEIISELEDLENLVEKR